MRSIHQRTHCQRRFPMPNCYVLFLLLIIPRGCAFLVPISSAKANNIWYESSRQINLNARSDDEDMQSMNNAAMNHLSSATPYNQDIARTLLPRFFFSLDRRNSTSHEQIRRYPPRPCPFDDPTSAQTTERMLRRMMENRYQSDGRTACPDSRTFNLVAGAFGRLRYRDQRNSDGKLLLRSVTWKEEPKVNPTFRSNLENKYNQIIVNDPNFDVMKRSSNNEISMTPVIKLQELLHLQLQLCHYEGWPDNLCPSVNMYNRILKRLSGDAGAALSIYQFMQSPIAGKLESSAGKIVCEPDAMTCFHVVKALSCHRQTVHPNSVEKRLDASQTVIQSMEDLSKELNIEFNSRHFPGDVSTDWFLNEAENVLNDLKDKCTGQENDDTSLILAKAMSMTLERWGKFAVNINSYQTESPDSARMKEKAINRAHELLCDLEVLAEEEGLGVCIPSSSYASVILGLSVSNEREAASKAEMILNRMIQQFSSSSNLDPKDAVIAYSACIAAYARINNAPKAEKILYQMVDLYESKDLGEDFVPDPHAFGTCIAIRAKYTPTIAGIEVHRKHSRLTHRQSWEQKEKNADDAEHILAMFERVVNAEKAKGNNDFEVHATPYNIAIHARIQTVNHVNKKDYQDANEFKIHEALNEEKLNHAMALLDHMEYEMKIAPDSYTYSILLNAWVQHSRPGREDAADIAEDLLRRKIQSSTSESVFKSSLDQIWPNVKHYSSVLRAHAKTKSPGGAKKALSLISEMEQQYSSSNVIPNNGEERYDEDTGSMYHVETRDAAKPDLICYSIVMDAFANSRLPEAGIVSYRLLGALESKYQAGDFSMKPSTRIYTAVIQSLIHSEFIGLFDDSEEIQKHQWVNNAEVAMHILKRMKANNVSPNSFTYNYIINCAAECKCHELAEARISFEVALRAFQELRNLSNDQSSTAPNDTNPDSFTYAFMLKACNNHLPKGSSVRAKTLKHTFKECCRTGHLNSAVLDRLYNGVSNEREFYEITGMSQVLLSNQRQDFSLDLYDLPTSWSRRAIKTHSSKEKARRRSTSLELYQ